MYFFKQFVLFYCLTGSSFANHAMKNKSPSSGSLVSVQSWRKIDFPLKVWNLFSSKKTEEVTIVSPALSTGNIECGVACHRNPECGGFIYDKTSGSCSMKSVKEVFKIIWNSFKVFKSLRVFKTLRLYQQARNLWQLMLELRGFLNALDMVCV